MVNERKNETKTDFDLLTYINQNKDFDCRWELQQTNDQYVQTILDQTSKKGTGDKGYPDLIYANDQKRLLILIENKASIKDHESKTGNNPVSYAVDGIKHYLFFFTLSNLKSQTNDLQRYFENWKIIGIAFSGDINDQYNHRLDTFIVKDDAVDRINETSILDEDDYIAYFENIDLEKISSNISKSSKTINNLLRNVDSQRRPILLSALMICLYDKESDFSKTYQNSQAATIINNIPITVQQVLSSEGIDNDKISILKNELSFVKTDKDLTTTDILKDILKELENKVIPLFKLKTAYDIIGKFYEEFLRYAGVANVKKGIVLTPNHTTTLFSELIDLKTDDVIFDPACGTGAFLIAGMNKLIETIERSSLPNKKEKIQTIKANQLIGIEKSTTMFTLAISNMLFRGDGKSQIYNEDFFTEETDKILKDRKPTIGFVNPPFGGKNNDKNPTKKEIQFLEKLLDVCSRHVVIIAPLSTYFKDDDIRTRILTKHRLKYVINMPSELFQPNAMAHTAIAVFETNIPHGESYKTIFYDLKDDGFVLSKSKGRTDPKSKWNAIKQEALSKIKKPQEHEDNINLVYKNVTGKDEWIIQAHSETDYSNLTEEYFLTKIRKHVIFQVKQSLGLLDEDIDELAMCEILVKNSITNEAVSESYPNKIDVSNWQEFAFTDIFIANRGKRLTTIDQISGEIAYLSSTKENNGIDNYISPPDYMTVYKNYITINNSGSVGYCFYHPYEFVASDHCTVIDIKDASTAINSYTAFFLLTLLEQMSYKYNFGREISDARLQKEKIKLPVKLNAKNEYEPDWQFMEDYIKSLPYSSNL